MPKVLIVEDDEAMAVALHDGFNYEGYDVKMANDGATGLQMATEGSHDLVILDVMLPKLSGLDVCKRVRRNGSKVPIIMLTARGQEIDKVLGLKVGADDYVTKPFSFLELMARVEAVLRRCSGFADQLDQYTFGDVSIDFKNSEAHKAGEELGLSPREFKLLRFMIDHRGEVLPRERLLDAVWGYDNVPFTRTVDMHIAKLRKKIEDKPSDPDWIITVHRLGYKFTG
ncbi:MAG: response regulator transcription factor [Deltaproteobacteria bacterium]|nr:response regulator transcription factor [Deltaproteobacteria bacterium]